MFLFAGLYFGGNILGSADIRMFILICPMILLWIAYIMQKTVAIQMRFNSGQK